MTNGRNPRTEPDPDQLRLFAKIARMYHERGIRQPQIAADLNISQPRVSRILKQAIDIGVVRTLVILPPGTHSELEQRVQEPYHLKDVVVVDTDGAGDLVLTALGAATADYLDATLTGGHTFGISSWSETLVSAVDLMRARRSPGSRHGGADRRRLGRSRGPDAGHPLDRSLRRSHRSHTGVPFRTRIGGFGRDPPNPDRRSLGARRHSAVVEHRHRPGRHRLPRTFTTAPAQRECRRNREQAQLLSLGAVGDVCLRYFDDRGEPVRSEFDQRLVGITRDELRHIPRRIGVAGGSRKFAAIRAALLGRWINVLITDLVTAVRLIDEDI